MNNLNKKLLILVSFLVSLVVPAAYLGLLEAFYDYKYLELVFNQSIFFVVIFFFSLLTSFSPDHVFQSWWKFARIAIPVCFALLLIINSDLLISPEEQWPALVNGFTFLLVYSTFIFGSFWQIWKGFRQK